MLIDSSKKIGIVCNDAGGANQIASLFYSINRVPNLVIAKGPAEKIWKSFFPKCIINNFDLKNIAELDYLITGTGWETEIEIEAIISAKNAQVYCIAVLDHWTGYPERFKYKDGRSYLPNEIWVNDHYAKDIANKLFKDSLIKQMPDYYCQIQVQKINPINNLTPNQILYILEPIASKWGDGRAGEFQALDYFFNTLKYFKFPENLKILLRPHPSEQKSKYLKYLSMHNRVKISSGSLSEDISESRWVFGAQSYAMYIALQAKRTVISSLPPCAPNCVLPHKEIKHIKDLISKNIKVCL